MPITCRVGAVRYQRSEIGHSAFASSSEGQCPLLAKAPPRCSAKGNALAGSGHSVWGIHLTDYPGQRMCLQPQLARGGSRINTGFLPPSRFIATAMDLAVVPTAERHGELITSLSAQRS